MSMDKTSGKRNINPFLGLILVALAGVSLFMLNGFMGKQARPQAYALANACIGEPQNGQFFNNICEKEINLRYCVRAVSGEENDICRTQVLPPGVGVDTYIADRRALGDDFDDRDVWACEAPYLPDMVVTPHNSALFREGCRKPEDG